jgi:S-adenosylmethionine hydrolase
MPAPILTLTTDFGLSDHYVGTMKGVILGICPRTQLVDISHQITPYAIPEAAYTIAQAYPYFPRGTVHVVVVDPGVGSDRRPILVEAAGQYFVAPDNGVLGMIFAREKHKVRLIANDRYFRRPVSTTFHGRDLFSPVAAHLARGVKPAQIGKRLDNYVRPPFEEPRQLDGRTWEGHILKIDHFGNLITNFRVEDLPPMEKLTIGRATVRKMVRTYAEAPHGELVAIEGSGGYLEVSMNQSSAAEKVRAAVSATVVYRGRLLRE